MTVDEILAELKERLTEVYGSRLHALVLHGSEARGEAQPDSDIDLLVVLNGPFALGEEIRRIVRASYPVVLRSDRAIDLQPASREAWEAQEHPLYRFAHEEGVVV